MSYVGRIVGGAAIAGALAALPPGAGAQEECEIVLGGAISLTGNYAANGLHTKAGYDFAIDKLNSEGGVKVGDQTCTMRVIYYDDESTPARAAQLVERLISQDDVQYMLGPYSSGLTAAVAPVTEQYEIPMVEAEGASRSLFNKGYKNLFAILSTSEQYLNSAIDLAAERRKSRQGPQRRQGRHGLRERPLFARRARRRARGHEEVRHAGRDRRPAAARPFRQAATLTKVKALQPDVLVVSGHEKGASTAVRQIAEMGVSVPMIAVTHCESADVVGNFGDAANGILCPTQWAPTMTYTDDFFGSASDYEKAFKEAYPEYANQEVPYQTAQASAAAQVFADAFERAGSLDKKALRDALAATDVTTFYGPIKFAPEGNNIAKPIVLRQILDGEYKVVAPQKFASEKLQYPRP